MTELLNSKKAIEYFFQFACIIAAISTTCWCVYIYSQDKDVCLVDFKQYNEVTKMPIVVKILKILIK